MCSASTSAGTLKTRSLAKPTEDSSRPTDQIAPLNRIAPLLTEALISNRACFSHQPTTWLAGHRTASLGLPEWLRCARLDPHCLSHGGGPRNSQGSSAVTTPLKKPLRLATVPTFIMQRHLFARAGSGGTVRRALAAGRGELLMESPGLSTDAAEEMVRGWFQPSSPSHSENSLGAREHGLPDHRETHGGTHREPTKDPHRRNKQRHKAKLSRRAGNNDCDAPSAALQRSVLQN